VTEQRVTEQRLLKTFGAQLLGLAGDSQSDILSLLWFEMTSCDSAL
jgi:hypothetical protein